MSFGNFQLLEIQITGQLDELHPVQQWLGNVKFHIGSCNEQHLGQVVIHLQIVIVERIVLLRIQYLQQGSRRIAAKINPHLIHFIQQDHWIDRPCTFHRLNNLARHCSYVCSTMSSNFRLIPHTAQGNAHELASQRPCNGLCQRRFTNARRTDETENLPSHLPD